MNIFQIKPLKCGGTRKTNFVASIGMKFSSSYQYQKQMLSVNVNKTKQTKIMWRFFNIFFLGLMQYVHMFVLLFLALLSKQKSLFIGSIENQLISSSRIVERKKMLRIQLYTKFDLFCVLIFALKVEHLQVEKICNYR